MDSPTIEWFERPSDSRIEELAVHLIRKYLAQDSNISTARLRALAPGRSGAMPFTVHLRAMNAGGPVPLQPEFVKLVKSDDEVRSFQEYASGTALVFGQHLARRPYFDSSSGLTVFGFKLFEHGDDLMPFFAVAQECPTRACRLLHSFCTRLQDWYGTTAPTGVVPLNVADDKLENLIANLDELSSATARAVSDVIHKVRAHHTVGSLTRVHGDLHLENILVPHDAEFCYLIDFAHASNAGSPCLDMARLEADIIYRCLPYDMSPDDLAQFERRLWSGELNKQQELSAGALVGTMREAMNLNSWPNAPVWLLTGRIVNGLKMIANTWLGIRPYKFAERRRGIVASLRILASNLEDALEGKTFNLSLVRSQSRITSEGFRSIRWLYSQRHYHDAFALAQDLSGANLRSQPEQSIIGSLAALSTSVPPSARQSLFRSGEPRVRSALGKGLKRLYHAALIAKEQPGDDLKRAVQLFEYARKALEESGDTFFTSVALDQLARCQLEVGEPDAAKISFRDSVQLKERTNDTAGLATSLGGLGLVELASGYYGEARQLFERDLELARRLGDRAAEIKIHNWLGQVALLNDFDLIACVDHLNRSILESVRLAAEQGPTQGLQGYSSALDVTFGFITLGCAFVFAGNVDKALECSDSAASALATVSGRNADFASALLELQTGMALTLAGHSRRAMIRSEGALAYLKTLSLLDFCDYSVRTIRFHANRGEAFIVSRLVHGALGTIRSLKLSKLYEAIIECEGKE